MRYLIALTTLALLAVATVDGHSTPEPFAVNVNTASSSSLLGSSSLLIKECEYDHEGKPILTHANMKHHHHRHHHQQARYDPSSPIIPPVVPTPPVCIPYLSPPTGPVPAMGAEMKAQFGLAPTYRNFNPGSYGDAPSMVLTQRAAWSALCEARPDPFFRGGYQAVIDVIRARLAEYMDADVSDVVLVENATSGINAILKSFPFQAGDQVLVDSTIYFSMLHTLDYVAQRYGVKILTAEVQFPVEGDSSYTVPVANLLNAAPAGAVKLCLFSHISSLPGVIMPIELLTRQCQNVGAKVFIDGAHAMGQIPISMKQYQSYGVTAYIANGHKWFLGAHGTAVLWVDPSAQSWVVPASMESQAAFTTEFEGIGTRDYTPWTALNATFNFRSWVGEDNIMNYIKETSDNGAMYLATLWGTDLAVPLNMSQAMTNIGLPSTNGTLMAVMRDSLLATYDIYTIPYEFPVGSGVYWIRISTMFYIDQDDYVFLGQVVMQYLGVKPAPGGMGSRWGEQRKILKEFQEKQKKEQHRITSHAKRQLPIPVPANYHSAEESGIEL